MPRIIMRGFQVAGEAFTSGMNLFIEAVSGGPATVGNEIVISVTATDFLSFSATDTDTLVWS